MHKIFEPLDFIAKLASLAPKPRVNLTRFHGVFAPNSKHRIQVTPSGRGKGKKKNDDGWAQRLKRVFNIDVETCAHCGGVIKIIACIEDKAVIDKILAHLKEKDALPSPPDALPETRAPPQTNLFG